MTSFEKSMAIAAVAIHKTSQNKECIGWVIQGIYKHMQLSIARNDLIHAIYRVLWQTISNNQAALGYVPCVPSVTILSEAKKKRKKKCS